MNKSLVLSGTQLPCGRTIYTPTLQLIERHSDRPYPNQSVGIFYDTTAVKKTSQVPLYPTSQLLSAVGGTLGLYIGISLLSAANFALESAGYLTSWVTARMK